MSLGTPPPASRAVDRLFERQVIAGLACFGAFTCAYCICGLTANSSGGKRACYCVQTIFKFRNFELLPSFFSGFPAITTIPCGCLLDCCMLVYKTPRCTCYLAVCAQRCDRGSRRGGGLKEGSQHNNGRASQTSNPLRGETNPMGKPQDASVLGPSCGLAGARFMWPNKLSRLGNGRLGNGEAWCRYSRAG